MRELDFIDRDGRDIGIDEGCLGHKKGIAGTTETI